MEDGIAPSENKLNTFTELFESVLPYMLSIGMTFEQFWYKDPHLVSYYLEAEKIRMRRKNEELWMLGNYVYHAIGSFAEILPAFPKKGAKVYPYVKEPFALSEEEVREREERDRQQRIANIKERMMRLVTNNE